MKIDVLRSFSTTGEQQIPFLNQINQLQKNRAKSAACGVFLAWLFSLLVGFLGAAPMLGWMLTKLVKSLVMLRRVYNH